MRLRKGYCGAPQISITGVESPIHRDSKITSLADYLAVVGFLVADEDFRTMGRSSSLAKRLIEETCDRQGIVEKQLINHSE